MDEPTETVTAQPSATGSAGANEELHMETISLSDKVDGQGASATGDDDGDDDGDSQATSQLAATSQPTEASDFDDKSDDEMEATKGGERVLSAEEVERVRMMLTIVGDRERRELEAKYPELKQQPLARDASGKEEGDDDDDSPPRLIVPVGKDLVRPAAPRLLASACASAASATVARHRIGFSPGHPLRPLEATLGDNPFMLDFGIRSCAFSYSHFVGMRRIKAFSEPDASARSYIASTSAKIRGNAVAIKDKLEENWPKLQSSLAAAIGESLTATWQWVKDHKPTGLPIPGVPKPEGGAAEKAEGEGEGEGEAGKENGVVEGPVAEGGEAAAKGKVGETEGEDATRKVAGARSTEGAEEVTIVTDEKVEGETKSEEAKQGEGASNESSVEERKEEVLDERERARRAKEEERQAKEEAARKEEEARRELEALVARMEKWEILFRNPSLASAPAQTLQFACNAAGLALVHQKLATWQQVVVSPAVLLDASLAVIVANGGTVPENKGYQPSFPGHYLPKRIGESLLLSPQNFMALAVTLPARLRTSPWRLLYSTARDGISMATLFRKIKGKGACLLVVRDSNKYVFGCFTNEEWRPMDRYYGNGECFVFQVQPECVAYRWARTNSYFMLSSNAMLAVGGGNHHSLLLYADLLTGASAPCDTFGSAILASSEEFEVAQVEIFHWSDMVDLIPPLAWLHITVGVVGVLIMTYTFMMRKLKEDLLISETFAALVVGVLLGPHCIRVLDPHGALGEATALAVLQELSRLVLAVQLVSAGLGLPLKYVERQWRTLAVLLGPTMLATLGISFALALALLPHAGVGWQTCLLVAACLTPTDPVLASTVLQGRFAEMHLPAPLRFMLQAESGANDGMALPYVSLPIALLLQPSLKLALTNWLAVACAYQVGLAIAAGLAYGLIARGLLLLGDRYGLIDEPSFLAHIIGLALGALGLVRAVGASGVLAVFVATIAFSSREPTAEEGRYDAINGIEIIVTITYFTYFGAFLPFAAWRALGVPRLLLFSALVLLLRRLPVLLALAPCLPELHRQVGSKRAVYCQAGFAGFFGPIGVGAVLYAAQACEELGGDATAAHVVLFVVVASVVVHGVTAAPLSRLLSSCIKRAEEEHRI
ncbi:unnamed protein product [Closterium sp. Yama58-4]|nr:unnamed protein product [Closterium sp. Yama58-4]